jgi:ABC-type transport system involved in multi-copper enzyme maturation permease subunit
VVLAKGFAHGLRALTLWLAVVPVVTIPFLLGGASRLEAWLSLLINWTAIGWALAAGLLASSWSRTWLRSVLAAAVFAFIFLFLLGAAVSGVLVSVGLPFGGALNGIALLTDAGGDWPYYLGLILPSQLFWAAAEMTLLSLLAWTLVVSIAAARTRRAWQEEPPSARMRWVQRTFFTPVLWLSFFRPWMRRKLERNPIGWLEQRTWSGRVVVWGWLAVLISFYSAVLTDQIFFRSSDAIHYLLSWLLAGSMAVGAASSFRRERESGVLELLLVSPLKERQIISGRLRGLWGQFLPTIGLLLGMWIYLSTFWHGGDPRAILFFASTFFTIPILGLFFSLQARNFVSAFLATLLLGLLLPMFLPELLRFFPNFFRQTPLGFEWNIGPSPVAAIWQLLIAGLFYEQLYHRLKHRAFPLERKE